MAAINNSVGVTLAGVRIPASPPDKNIMLIQYKALDFKGFAIFCEIQG